MDSPTLSNRFSWSSTASTPPLYDSGSDLTPISSSSSGQSDLRATSYFDPWNKSSSSTLHHLHDHDDFYSPPPSHHHHRSPQYHSHSHSHSHRLSSTITPKSHQSTPSPPNGTTTTTTSQAFLDGLFKVQQQKNVETQEWKWRCGLLQHQVDSLTNQVKKLTKERDELRLETVAIGTANLVMGFHEDSHHPSSKSSSSLNTLNVTSCHWNGTAWVPLTTSTSDRPQIDPTKSMSKQDPPPCNSFYLLGACEVPRCRFCHTYDLTQAQVNEMRRGAKYHLCNAIQNGVPCPDGADCIYGHFCPRGPACSRQHCAFNDEQHRVVPQPRPILRRRTSRLIL